VGLWLGSLSARGLLQQHMKFPPRWVAAARVFTIGCLMWRHLAGQTPIHAGPENLINRLFDKWHLGPLRLLNAMALTVLLMHYSEWLKAHMPRIAFLEQLGAASLPVFCTHLVIVLVALSLVGPSTPERSVVLDVFLVLAGLAGLYLAALVTFRLDREERARRKAGKPARQAQRESTAPAPERIEP